MAKTNIVTANDLSEIYGISRETVLRRVRSGDLPFLPLLGRRPYHFDLDHIDQVIRTGSFSTEKKPRRRSKQTS